MDAVTITWICINLVGAVCVNLGQNVMKLGHNKREGMDLPEEEKPNIKRIREWQIGVVIFLSGGIANFVSFGYAPQSLLSGLGSVQFVSNVVFASLVLKEPVTIRTIFATALIVGGCVVIVIFGANSAEIMTVPMLMEYYKSPAYIAYLVCMFVMAVGFYVLYRYGKAKQSKGNAPQYWDRLMPVAYVLFCAPIGTQSVLFSKTVSVLMRATLSGDSQLKYWFTYVMLLAFIVTSIFWVTRLNKSLKLFTAIVIVPTMQIGWTVFSILSGGIYFQEFQEYSGLEMAMFVVGVLVIVFGVFLLTPPPPRTADKYEEMDSIISNPLSQDLEEPLSPRLQQSTSHSGSENDLGTSSRGPRVMELPDEWDENGSPQQTSFSVRRHSLDGHVDSVDRSNRNSRPLNLRRVSADAASSPHAADEPPSHTFGEQLQAIRAALREDFDLDFSNFQRFMRLEDPTAMSPVMAMPIPWHVAPSPNSATAPAAQPAPTPGRSAASAPQQPPPVIIKPPPRKETAAAQLSGVVVEGSCRHSEDKQTTKVSPTSNSSDDIPSSKESSSLDSVPVIINLKRRHSASGTVSPLNRSLHTCTSTKSPDFQSHAVLSPASITSVPTPRTAVLRSAASTPTAAGAGAVGMMTPPRPTRAPPPAPLSAGLAVRVDGSAGHRTPPTKISSNPALNDSRTSTGSLDDSAVFSSDGALGSRGNSEHGSPGGDMTAPLTGERPLVSSPEPNSWGRRSLSSRRRQPGALAQSDSMSAPLKSRGGSAGKGNGEESQADDSSLDVMR